MALPHAIFALILSPSILANVCAPAKLAIPLPPVMLTNVLATAILATTLALSMLTNTAATAILAPILTLSMNAGHGIAWPYHEYIASPRFKARQASVGR